MLRTILSTIIAQGLDSIIFITISLYGTMENSIILKMILFEYLFKVLYEILLAPATYIVVKWGKKKENINVYDHDIKYRVVGR